MRDRWEDRGCGCLALPRCNTWLNQWVVDDAADGLHSLSLKEGPVVSLNNMHQHLAVTYLKKDDLGLRQAQQVYSEN